MFKKKRWLLGICMCGVMILSGLTACRTTTPTTTTTTTSTTISATPSLTPTTSTLTTPTATQTTSPTTTDFNGVNSASSTSANGLSLSLSLDSKTYLPCQEVSIVIDIKNTLLTENDVPVSDNWSYSNLGLGPCDNGPGGFGYPYGIAIFQGNYTPLNLSTATPLSLYAYCVLEKYQWVEKYLGYGFTKKLILTRDKTLVRGDMLIDDKPEITGIQKPVWEHIIYDFPYNRHITGNRRIVRWKNWRKILGI